MKDYTHYPRTSYITLALFLTLLHIFSCNTEKEKDGSAVPLQVEKTQTVVVKSEDAVDSAGTENRPFVDSFRIEMDSLMKANIKLPPIYKHEIVEGNSDAVTKFSALSQATSGKLKILVNSSVVAKELMSTIKVVSKPESDLLILIDKTGSMGDDIESIKQSMAQIIDTIKLYKKTRLAVAFYGDKNCDGMTWFQFRNFETDYEAARQFISSTEVNGGGDWPESAYDAAMLCLNNEFWQSAKKRNIILIGDAPPLEKPLSEYSMSDILARTRQSRVAMNFYPIIITPVPEVAKVEKSELITYKPEVLTSAVYPNPCNAEINVGFQECGKYYLEIFNAAGEEVANDEQYGVFWTKDVRDLADGFYILRIIHSSHHYELIKFIVKH